jgi:hypothetical protein
MSVSPTAVKSVQTEIKMAKTNWIVLTKRFGEDVSSPTPKEFESALQELVLTDDEHPNTWLRVEDSEGKMHLLDAYSSNKISYSIYADQDDTEAERSYTLRTCTIDEAFRLWTFLAEGDFKKVEDWFSQSTPLTPV